MRSALQKLTREDVARAVQKHLSAKDLAVVIVTKDAQGLKEKLAADAASTIKYDAEKPAELLSEDKLIGARKLSIAAEKVKISPVDQVFAN
jgi:zinc protease